MLKIVGVFKQVYHERKNVVRNVARVIAQSESRRMGENDGGSRNSQRIAHRRTGNVR